MVLSVTTVINISFGILLKMLSLEFFPAANNSSTKKGREINKIKQSLVPLSRYFMIFLNEEAGAFKFY